MFREALMKLKSLDLSLVQMVHCGRPCPQTFLLMSDTDIMHALERKESFVYWFQPKVSQTVDEQIAALKCGEKYYALSLRLMKSVWRHVRLKQNFKNIEKAHSGGSKLKIPTALLLEKRRTQSRFHVFLKLNNQVLLKYINSFVFFAGDAQ